MDSARSFRDNRDVKLCIVRDRPGRKFAFVHTRAKTRVEDQRAASDEFEKMKRFDAALSLEAQDAKSFTTHKEGDLVVDYSDVMIKGYLSTFKATTESDRQGDYVEPGAFKETLRRFMQNPVLLRDHFNSTDNLSGSFSVAREDTRGLYIEANVSNAPDCKSIRFKVAEGHLRTLSMGGIFHYKEDGRGIFKVDLWEGSLTPIPANPDALVSVRSLNDSEKKFIKCANQFASYHHFLQASQSMQNRAEVAA